MKRTREAKAAEGKSLIEKHYSSNSEASSAGGVVVGGLGGEYGNDVEADGKARLMLPGEEAGGREQPARGASAANEGDVFAVGGRDGDGVETKGRGFNERKRGQGDDDDGDDGDDIGADVGVFGRGGLLAKKSVPTLLLMACIVSVSRKPAREQAHDVLDRDAFCVL